MSTYKRYADGKGKQVHVVETRLGRFEAETKECADLLALMAENAERIQSERHQELRQMMLDEQARDLAWTDNRRGA